MILLHGLVGIAIAILVFVLIKMILKNQLWSKQGIKGPKPLPFIGTLLPILLRQKSIGNLSSEIYEKYKNTERFAGLFTFNRPELVILKPEDAEAILIKDFNHFVNRAQYTLNEKLNPHTASLFVLCGNRWRSLRKKVSPAFTIGKIKGMVNQMAECWDAIDIYISNRGLKTFNMKQVIYMFGTNVIASVAFGMDPKDLGGPDTEFRKNAMEFFNFTTFRLFIFLTSLLFPLITDGLRIPGISKRLTDYFANITLNTIEQRRVNKIERNDFLQMMMQLQEKGSVDATTWNDEDNHLGLLEDENIESVEITENLIVSQAILFFTAGFESSSNTIIFGLVDILQRPDIVVRVRKEIKSAVARNNGFCYQALKEMTYLEQCINETLRLHPVVHALFRTCTKPYQFPESNVKLDEGTGIFIPIFGYHMDPKYWDNPTEYRPERFNSDQKRTPMTYLPFGIGPRSCIAMKFALLEVKVGMAKMLMNYEITIHPDTEIPIRSNTASIINSPASPVIFNLKRRNLYSSI